MCHVLHVSHATCCLPHTGGVYLTAHASLSLFDRDLLSLENYYDIFIGRFLSMFNHLLAFEINFYCSHCSHGLQMFSCCVSLKDLKSCLI